MRSTHFWSIAACLLALSGLSVKAQTSAQEAKRPFTIEDLRQWNRVTHKHISNNGLWVAVTTEKWRGDGDRNGRVEDYSGDAFTTIYDAKGNAVRSFCPIKGFSFSSTSSFAVVATKETEASRDARALKEQNKKGNSAKGKEAKDTSGQEAKGKNAKEKKDEAVPDTLWIYNLKLATCEQIDSLRNYKLSQESDWLAYQRGKKDSTLYVRTLDNTRSLAFENVKQYGFARKAEVLYYLTTDNAKPATLSLYTVSLAGDATPQLLKQTKGRIEKVTFTEDGSAIAFMFANAPKDKAKTNGMSLWYGKVGSEVEMLSDSINTAFTQGWEISADGSLQFSKAGDKLAFGIAPVKREADTTMLKSARPEVQVWSWNEPVEYTVQDYNKERDARKTYAAVALLNDKKIVQLTDQQFDRYTTMPDMKGSMVIVSDSKPYSNSSMWEGRTRSDQYLVNVETGERRALATADYNYYRLSPSGKFAYAYITADSLWRTIDLETLQQYDVTSPRTFTAWDEENDVPDFPSAHGIAGWLPADEALLIYDRYDIWKVPARGGEMVNLTKNGRTNGLQYRLLRLDPEKASEPIELNAVQYLSVFNETTKGYAIARTTFRKPVNPVVLIGGDYKLSTPVKAKKADKVIFTKETFSIAPDIYLSDMKFKAPVQITHLMDQQNQFIWGTAQLIEWTSYKGVKLQGVLYLPENFDNTKKYPMIVNFYERNSDTFFSYREPQPHRSTPDYHLYVSNGYVVFNPDVRYVDGHPGESCYDCVMSGIDKVLSLGFVDEKRIGGSGHSWGGYQYAYLATRTDRFAAIESGAPVVNMFSAYGGIRWGSGRARSFQYEHQQSRIGGSPWEVPELYAENSSLFNMDKVKTPILIMHNDTDGHVPWYQGIEYFVAMKRLGKPCWLLNYTGEPHWPVRMANRFDFQIRLMQFFDHYLKGAPMPKWMEEGIKAVDQPYELGY